MSDKTAVTGSLASEGSAPTQDEMDELKRDMRSAQWAQWAQANQNQIIAAVVVLVMALVAGGMWKEHLQSQRESAATLYQQALNQKDAGKQVSLMQSVVDQFGSSAYGALAEMQLAKLDREHAEAHLQALADHPEAMKQWVWQARLDLAALKIAAGDKAAANALLSKSVGQSYQQLRHYLLALASDDAAAKQQHLQKAADAPSTDTALKQKIEALLAQPLS